MDSSTFGQGVRLLPDAVQHDIRRLYYVLRTIDDLIDDEQPDAAPRLEAVERWAEGLGPAESEETELLEDLSRRHPLSRPAILEFCAGMRHDLTGGTIETERDLERYCQQAGGAVGVLLAGILGTRSENCARGMAILGRAMQRTNILRDIDEDYSNGRIYIARSTIERYGFPHPGAREQLLRDQIPRADSLYEQGAYSIQLLRNGAQAMALATALYREILRQIERDGYGRSPGRATISDERKEALVARYTRGAHPM
ncbi:MAG TPA: squalene/phytoene synthase family protein [Solirubrobacteraceae bacterium]|nr:squalene/phytoene synthase family protein [Solirubrobacteraceae bacterium]